MHPPSHPPTCLHHRKAEGGRRTAARLPAAQQQAQQARGRRSSRIPHRHNECHNRNVCAPLLIPLPPPAAAQAACTAATIGPAASPTAAAATQAPLPVVPVPVGGRAAGPQLLPPGCFKVQLRSVGSHGCNAVVAEAAKHQLVLCADSGLKNRLNALSWAVLGEGSTVLLSLTHRQAEGGHALHALALQRLDHPLW